MKPIDIGTYTAELEIGRVLRRYCRSMDRIDPKLGYSVWHEDGLADYGSYFQGTGRRFIDWVCDFHRTVDATSHQIANTTIDLRGEHAASETYITAAVLFRKNGRQLLTTGRGRYLDDWSQRGGRWAIDKRRYIQDFAVTQETEAMPGWGRRDHSDPSYEMLRCIGSA